MTKVSNQYTCLSIFIALVTWRRAVLPALPKSVRVAKVVEKHNNRSVTVAAPKRQACDVDLEDYH